MKLEIYEPGQIGYVSLSPYDYEYNGRYPEIERFLSEKPTFRGMTIDFADTDADGVEIVTPDDGELYLRYMKEQLFKMKVWDLEIVQNG